MKLKKKKTTNQVTNQLTKKQNKMNNLFLIQEQFEH